MVLALLLFNSCDQSNSQLFDLILEIKSQNDQLLNEVKTLQIKSDLLISELRASAAKQEELLAKVNDLQSQMSSLLTQIATLNKQLENQNADVQLIKNKLSELETQYQGIFKQLEELQKLSQILAEIEKMKTQISQLDSRYNTILSGLAQNKQQLDALKTQITSVQTQLAENLTKIAQFTVQLGDQGVVIANILKQIDLLKANNAELIKLMESLLIGKSPVPTNGLLGWWPFNGNANDESGNKLNGIVSNAVLTTDRSNRSNSAYSFDTNQSITIQNSQNLNPYPMTISLWYNISTITSTVPLIKKYSPATWNGYMIGICDCNDAKNTQINNNIYGTFPWYLRGVRLGILGNYDQAPFLQPNIVTQKWYHYVFVADQTGGKIYIDGKLIASDQWTGQAGSIFNNFLLQIGGEYEGGVWYKGKIDDIGIWNRVLSADEVSKIFSGQGF
jgi:peptidoglycan hydrolase CwlO-like protein